MEVLPVFGALTGGGEAGRDGEGVEIWGVGLMLDEGTGLAG